MCSEGVPGALEERVLVAACGPSVATSGCLDSEGPGHKGRPPPSAVSTSLRLTCPGAATLSLPRPDSEC